MSVTTGIGYDCRQLATGRPLILGGVRLEHDRGLLGHSDADVLTHAVIDALLGAAGLGDIGHHFPDTDPRYEDADSMRLLEEVRSQLAGRKLVIVWVDVTVICELPKLSPYRERMRERLIETVGTDA